MFGLKKPENNSVNPPIATGAITARTVCNASEPNESSCLFFSTDFDEAKLIIVRAVVVKIT